MPLPQCSNYGSSFFDDADGALVEAGDAFTTDSVEVVLRCARAFPEARGYPCSVHLAIQKTNGNPIDVASDVINVGLSASATGEIHWLRALWSDTSPANQLEPFDATALDTTIVIVTQVTSTHPYVCVKLTSTDTDAEITFVEAPVCLP